MWNKKIKEEINKYFSISTKEELERDWIKLKQETNHIDSPSVDEFIKNNNNKNELKMKKNRGALTSEVQELATALLGREINVRELRLMPYFIHLGMDGSIVSRERLFEGDREVMDIWNKEGRVICKVGDVPKISHEFWNIMAKIVHKSYVLNLEGE